MTSTIQTKENGKLDFKIGSLNNEFKIKMEDAQDFLKADFADEGTHKMINEIRGLLDKYDTLKAAEDCVRFGGIELQKTHFVFRDRTEFKSELECSIIGYYDVIIPKDNILDLNNMLRNCTITESNVLRQIKRSGIGDDVMSLESDENFIILKCYKGEGDYVEELESIYFYKNQIEHRVELAMAQTNIRKYGLRIEVNTLDF